MTLLAWLLERVWSLAGIAPQRRPPKRPSPETVEVLPRDWTSVGNHLRRALGLPTWAGPPRYPTVEELAEWERLVPGSVDRLRKEARKEAEHRAWRERQRPAP